MLTGLPSDIAHTKTVITASLGDRMETVSVCLEWVVRGPWSTIGGAEEESWDHTRRTLSYSW